MKILSDNKFVYALTLFLAFFFFYMATVPDRLPEGDEAILLGVADRVSRFGFSWLPPRVNETDRFSSYGFFEDGFSKYGLGQSLILIPSSQAFRLAKRATSAAEYFQNVLLLYLPGPLIGAGTLGLFFLICEKLNYALLTAYTLTLILGFASMTWPYTQTLFSDPTLGFLWMLAFYTLLAYRDSKNTSWLAVSGAAVGFAVLVKIVAIYAVVIFSAYCLNLIWNDSRDSGKRILSKTSIKPMAAFFLPLAAMGWTVLWYNHLRYGDYFIFGYLDMKTYDIRDSMFGFNVSFLTGLYAQLISAGKGFFFYNPSAVLGVIGWHLFYIRHRAESLLLTTMIICMILIYSKWYGWHGDWCWGLRYWSCLTPFFLLMSAPILERLVHSVELNYSNLKKLFVTTLITTSCFVQILGVGIRSKDYILTAAKVEIFSGNFFSVDWPMRDDSLQLHFIPEFSPLMGHWWMMRVIANRNNPEMVNIFQHPPWRKLNNTWKPEKIDRDKFRYNIWWLHAWAADVKGVNGLLACAAILYLSSGALFFFTAKSLLSTSRHKKTRNQS